VANILKGVDRAPAVDPKRFAEAPESALHAEVVRASGEIGPPLAAHRYDEAMKILLGLRPAIDLFFDKVLVMTDDAQLRENRLSLLAEVRTLFLRFADLSRIVIEGEKKQA
jgi:glycyl-tRNA synthetase beta chain